jgi:CubicO group peptidase (beta-lactamase class C family)
MSQTPMFRTTLFAALLLIVFLPASVSAQGLPTAVPEDVGMSSERLDRVSAALEAYVDRGEVAGSVAIVVRHGKVAYLEAFGHQDIEAGRSMATDSIFRIASQSKAIVTTAIMMLQEEGKLLISDRLANYIPEFAETHVAVATEDGGYDLEAGRPITLRHLITHSSGISYGTGPASAEWDKAGFQQWYFADKNEVIGETIARMASLPFDAQPGERWIYGYGIDILGAVVEKASGMALDAYLETHIFDPLSMDDTHFYLPNEKRNRFAAVYSRTPGGELTRAPDSGAWVGQGAYVDGPRKSFSGGAGLLSTANDYARFLQMLLNGGELDGRRLLSPTTVNLMTQNHLGDIPFRPGQGFGLGFSVVTDVGERGVPGSLGEFGWGGAYNSNYWVDPANDLLVVYLTQLRPTGGLDDRTKIRTLVYQAIIE